MKPKKPALCGFFAFLGLRLVFIVYCFQYVSWRLQRFGCFGWPLKCHIPGLNMEE
ncbi:hypothetical protein MICA_2223 [Micavibrio aeruginosavorus ARL-13]|uniref:Uncharacterized protein n=1 Tax=Micavibrio aeruginosavorus (strain ARL-13) TaxID=856793 RepID=G2KS20_MICAA|nr:hypothetical protein MICA_2223 [Micavibrio aeruginosavorus ARL-13]